eukprot:scaffold319258_cov26-Prasinocladus_malaysianus.AAC.1
MLLIKASTYRYAVLPSGVGAKYGTYVRVPAWRALSWADDTVRVPVGLLTACVMVRGLSLVIMLTVHDAYAYASVDSSTTCSATRTLESYPYSYHSSSRVSRSPPARSKL